MSRALFILVSLGLAVASQAAPVAVTPYTVVARVDSFERYRAFPGAGRFSLSMPYGSDSTVVATIIHPESLAGREIALPFESRNGGKELLVQRGAIFCFEHYVNLRDLRAQTDSVRRRAIAFPLNGVVVLGPEGEAAEAHKGVLPASAVAESKKASALR